jgi:uncharacterized protein YegL
MKRSTKQKGTRFIRKQAYRPMLFTNGNGVPVDLLSSAAKKVAKKKSDQEANNSSFIVDNEQHVGAEEGDDVLPGFLEALKLDVENNCYQL